MSLCPGCGVANPALARFCSDCGTPLASTLTPPPEERKVVSVLFVDLVGFTAWSHGTDPEDVRAVLEPYHRLLKAEIERFGGTVEKFIGDAVMAVFGAPVVHEDDAERAVRAGLRIIEAIAEMNEVTPHLDLAVRAAVNSGEVLVVLGASPEAGEGLVTGDVVNTASRLQGVAPVGGVAVGATTHRATKDHISYEQLDSVIVKGKPEPISVWRALSARRRFGVDQIDATTTPFIGREPDLAALEDAYRRTVQERSVQLVTVAGEPGVGKTRLLTEFRSFIDDQEGPVSWLRGRSLPYGEGITFWALGEIVKAQAGILESDDSKTAAGKLRVAIDAVVEDTAERAWLFARTAPLVGAGSSPAAGSTDKTESFTAWRRLLEAIAIRGPLVAVFEDIHWADRSMLDFIDYVLKDCRNVSLLVLCTARPELYVDHPEWGWGGLNFTTIELSSLSDSETAQLISALLSQPVLPAEIHSALLERAGGNPLYVEEFVRMLSDNGILRRRGRSVAIDPDAVIPVPDNVQALIAARLDTLPQQRKALLQDASVAGKVFWSGAVTTMGQRDEPEVEEGLDELVSREFVRPVEASSIEGEREFTFWHGLVRDVAYSQIARRSRGTKHRAMAEWIERSAGERVSDQSEVLVHHYSQALALARAAHDPASGELIEPTRRFLILAGDRAADLDVSKAGDFFKRALELLPSGHPPRGPTLVKAGISAFHEGSLDEAKLRAEESLAESVKSGDLATQGEATLLLSALNWYAGNSSRSRTLLAEAVGVLEQTPEEPRLVTAYAMSAQEAAASGRPQLALELSEKAVAVARRLGAEKEMVSARGERGMYRCDLGDLGGREDLRAAITDGVRLGLEVVDLSVLYGGLAEWTWWIEGPSAAKKVHEDHLRFAGRRGLVESMGHAKAEFLRVQFDLGEWDELLKAAGDLMLWGEAHGNRQAEALALSAQLQVLVFRGRTDQAAALQGRLLGLARAIEDLQILVPALAVAASVDLSQGRTLEAGAVIAELDQLTSEHHGWRARCLPTVIRMLILMDWVERAETFMSGMVVSATRDRLSLATGHALVTEAAGRVEDAGALYQELAERWTDYGFVLEEGQAHLGLARCLIALGDRAAATEPLTRAGQVFAGLGARPLLEEVDRHLGRISALSS